ncbi:MAG: hypothetical protein AAF556_03410 [Pseudomonadota bacterium]
MRFAVQGLLQTVAVPQCLALVAAIGVALIADAVSAQDTTVEPITVEPLTDAEIMVRTDAGPSMSGQLASTGRVIIDVPAVSRQIPRTFQPLNGRPLSFDTLNNLFPGRSEVGRIINAANRDFGGNNEIYRMEYAFGETEEPGGKLAYSDGNSRGQTGHFLIAGTEGGRAGMCRAPASMDVSKRCRVIFQITENLFEARGASSVIVLYRFKLVPAPPADFMPPPPVPPETQ